MPQTITKGYKALVAEARQSIQEVTAEQAMFRITEHGHVVRVEDQLGASRVRAGALEERDELCDQLRVEAGVELVGKEH